MKKCPGCGTDNLEMFGDDQTLKCTFCGIVIEVDELGEEDDWDLGYDEEE